MSITRNSSHGRSAFTLTEIAVVLGIAGFLIASIWPAASSAWNNYRVTTAIRQMMKVASNVRDNFNGLPNWTILASWPALVTRVSWTNNSLCSCTNSLDALGLIPVEMRRTPSAGPGNSPIDGTLGSNIIGSFDVELVASNPPTFTLWIMNIAQADCIKILMELPLSDASLGITQLSVWGTSDFQCPITNGQAQSGSNCAGAIASGLTPMHGSVAQTICSGAASTNPNQLGVSFKLR